MVHRALEGRIHLDDDPLRIAAGDGERGVFKSGAEGRSCVLFCGGLGPRKWGCGIHTATLARDDSQKKARHWLSNTLVFPKREQWRQTRLSSLSPTSLLSATLL